MRNIYQWDPDLVRPYPSSDIDPLAQLQGNCVNPNKGLHRKVGLRLWTRCGKCRNCKMSKKVEWLLREEQEYYKSKRCWFVTLTFWQPRLNAAIRLANIKHAQDVKENKEGAKTLAKWKSELLYLQVQKWIKRVRKNSKAKFTYLCVFEIGNGKRAPEGYTPVRKGNPHFHLLVFEKDDNLRKRHMNDAWRKNGFFKGRLVKDPSTDTDFEYTSKYMHKITTEVEYEGYAFLRCKPSIGFGKGYETRRTLEIQTYKSHRANLCSLWYPPQTIQVINKQIDAGNASQYPPPPYDPPFLN